jgi:hypothetical protein
LNDSSYTFAPGTLALSDIHASGNSDSAQIFVASIANGPGIVTLGSTAGVSVINGANGSSSMTINGTLANLNAALNTLTYTPNATFTGEAQVYVVLNNSLNGLGVPNGVTFDVLDPNGPSVIGPASETLALNQSLAFTGTNTFSVTDPQASGTSDSVRIGLTYGTVSLGTTNGLTFTNGSNNSHLMTVMGTLADLNVALSTLTYTAQNGLAGANPLYIDVNNSIDNLTAADIVPMIIAAPALNAPATESLNGTGSLTFPAGSINVTDTGAIYYLDGFAYESVTLSAANGSLTLGSTSGLLYSYGANNSSVISVTGTLANVNAALSGLVYTPNPGFTGSDALQIAFKDQFDGLIASATVSLAVIGTPTITAPASVSLTQNSSQVFSSANGDAITVSDSGPGASSDSLTLSVSHGALTLSTVSGLTFTTGSNGSASFTVTGTIASLNAALNGLTYTPASNYAGSDSLAISLNDAVDSLSASKSVALTVSGPPAITAPPTATVLVVATLVFAPSKGNGISIADLNAGTTVEPLTLTATDGTLLLGSTTGITFISGANGGASMRIQGTLANLNAALNGLTFRPIAIGSASVVLSYTDVGTGQLASATINITVQRLVFRPGQVPASGSPSSAAATPSAPSRAGTVASAVASTSTSDSDDENSPPPPDALTQWQGLKAAVDALNG